MTDTLPNESARCNSLILNNSHSFACSPTDVCLGDLGPAPTDEAGRRVVLLRCTDHENENPDVVLRASPGNPPGSAGLSSLPHPEPQRPLAHHHHTGNPDVQKKSPRHSVQSLIRS